jgi:hypothetical protein
MQVWKNGMMVLNDGKKDVANVAFHGMAIEY